MFRAPAPGVRAVSAQATGLIRVSFIVVVDVWVLNAFLVCSAGSYKPTAMENACSTCPAGENPAHLSELASRDLPMPSCLM